MPAAELGVWRRGLCDIRPARSAPEVRVIRSLLAAALLAVALPVVAAVPCSVEIAASDRIAYDTTLIEVSRRCATFTVHLRHVGEQEKTQMGHNWVLTRAADLQAVNDAGLLGGFARGFVPPGDPRVIAATRLLGAGEADSVSFAVERLVPGEDYRFFCSFPGHASLMQGRLRLVD